MNHRVLASLAALAPVAVTVLLAQPSVLGQTRAAPTKQAVVSRTPWGDPDLQGVYTWATPTPLERPIPPTESELAEIEKRRAAVAQNAGGTQVAPNVGTYNDVWTENEAGRPAGRPSLIVDPENGRLPPLTPEAQNKRKEVVAKVAARTIGTPPFENVLYNHWSDLTNYIRCLARPMPRIGANYNHGVQILQTRGQVVIRYETLNDVRVIPLDGRPHLDSKIRQWNGDARGRWEGDTLVVDWTNFTDKQMFEGGSINVPAASTIVGIPQGNLHITERFTKVDSNTINYTVTVEDPTTWTRPWTFILPWRSDDSNYQNPEDLYEFACHEGNYRMIENSIRGSQAVKGAQARQK